MLLEASVPVVSHSTCLDTMGAIPGGITEGMICAGGEEDKDACQVSGCHSRHSMSGYDILCHAMLCRVTLGVH